MLELAGDGPGAALDAGMGPGRLAAALDGRGWTVSGIDVSSRMVELARARIPHAAERLLVGSIEQLPSADNSFDLALATGVLEYTHAPSALAELARVLRTEGRVIVSYPNPSALYHLSKVLVVYPLLRLLRRRNGGTHPRSSARIAPDGFEQLLRSVGLEPRARAYTSYLPIPAPLDLVIPRTTERVAERLERSGRAAPRLAVQVVYLAVKA